MVPQENCIVGSNADFYVNKGHSMQLRIIIGAGPGPTTGDYLTMLRARHSSSTLFNVEHESALQNTTNTRQGQRTCCHS
jgi:hypothetical protein